MLWYVVGLVSVPEGLASNDGDAAVGATSWQIRRRVEKEELVAKRTAVRGVGGRSGAPGEDFQRADLVKGNLVLNTVASVPFLTPCRMVSAVL